MIKREMSEHILDMAKEYPVLTIVGPRQYNLIQKNIR